MLPWGRTVYFYVHRCRLTPPKFNIAPEEWWLEDEFPVGNCLFLGAMLNFWGVKSYGIDVGKPFQSHGNALRGKVCKTIGKRFLQDVPPQKKGKTHTSQSPRLEKVSSKPNFDHSQKMRIEWSLGSPKSHFHCEVWLEKGQSQKFKVINISYFLV